MKKRIIIVLLGLFSRYGLSQVKLSGRFTAMDDRSIPYVDLTASVGDSVVAGTLTDDLGAFTLDMPSGTYTLRASLFGKKLYERKLVLKHALDLGIMQVKTGLQLGEVAVTGQKKLIEQKVDRLVFNVENALAASGGDALDALKITPGLRVENDKISMIGKGSLRVMVDGRMLPLSGEDLTSYLQSISADDIKSIEVITTPPAKYEAEGNSGLINIIYKKGRRDAWNADLRSSYVQTTYPAYTLGGTFSYRKDKLSLFLNAAAKAGAEAVVERYHVFYPAQPWIGQMDRKDRKDYLSGRIALDYKLNEKTKIGFQYLGSIHNPDIQDSTTMNIYGAPEVLDSVIQSHGFNDQRNDNHSLNLHYLNKMDATDKSFSVDLDYFRRHASQDRSFAPQNHLAGNRYTQSASSAENMSDQDMHNYGAKVDVVYPIKWAKLSYGAKLSFTVNDNKTGFFKVAPGASKRDSTQSDRFRYIENTQALYISASKKLSGKWQGKLGLRLENTQIESASKTLNSTHKKDYTRLFPSCYLTYIMSADHTFSLSYGRRIKRPAYWRLNPLRWYISPSYYVEGNPFLQPSFTDNLELHHSWKDNLTTRVSFSVTSDGFNRIPKPDNETKEQVARDENYYTLHTYSLSETYTFKRVAWWQSYNQLCFYYNRSKLDRKDLNTPEQNGSSFYVVMNNTLFFDSSHTFQGAVDFWYNAPTRSDIFREKASYSLSLALKLLLLDKRLRCSFRARDILKTSSSDYMTYTNGIKQVYNSYFDNRRFVLSLSFKLGNDLIRVRKRAFGNEAEKQRAGG